MLSIGQFMKKVKPKVLGLFAGCGGLDYGFQQEGFEIVYANDIEKNIKDTYEYNLKHPIDINDISKVNKSTFENLRFIKLKP